MSVADVTTSDRERQVTVPKTGPDVVIGAEDDTAQLAQVLTKALFAPQDYAVLACAPARAPR